MRSPSGGATEIFMDTLLITLGAVVALLICAVPGYLLCKFRAMGENAIPALTKVLLFVGQPCLVITTFQKLPFDAALLLDLVWFALLVLLINAVMLGGAYLVLRRRQGEALYRIMTIATALANCAFFGVPILEALYGEAASELLVYTSVYAVVMNILGWTVVSAIIAKDRHYMSLKKIVLNPATMGLVLAVLLYVLRINFFESFASLGSMIEIAGRMTSPLSMIVMGMRLSYVGLRELFSDVRIYLTIGVKQVVMPLIGFAILFLLPMDSVIKQVLYIMCACPVAAIVQSFSEMIGQGQKEGAKLVLLGTILSIVTLPIMALLIPLL